MPYVPQRVVEKILIAFEHRRMIVKILPCRFFAAGDQIVLRNKMLGQIFLLIRPQPEVFGKRIHRRLFAIALDVTLRDFDRLTELCRLSLFVIFLDRVYFPARAAYCHAIIRYIAGHGRVRSDDNVAAYMRARKDYRVHADIYVIPDRNRSDGT